MLLVAFQRLLVEISVISLLILVEISVIALLPVALITNEQLYPLSRPPLIEVFYFLNLLISGSSLLERSLLKPWVVISLLVTASFNSIDTI